MRLLSLHLYGHDANVTYYDGTEIKYLNIERLKQQKKYYYTDTELQFVKRDLQFMSIDWNNLDAVSFCCHEYTVNDLDWTFDDGPVREVSKEIFQSAFPFIDITAKKYYRVMHHYAHKRSADWLYGDTDKALVIDGHGDYKEHLSVFDKNTKVKNMHFSDMLSIGRLYALTTLLFMKSSNSGPNSVQDNVGKIMGLLSYGKFNEDYADYLRQFDFEDVTAQMYNHVQFEKYQYKKRPKVIEQCTQDSIGYVPSFDMVDWMHTWQEVLFDFLIEFCHKYFDKDEKFSFSGGVAHNVCFNERLSKEFPNVVIPPCVGDEGLSLGCMYELLKMHDISIAFPQGQYTDESVDKIDKITVAHIANSIITGKVVANFQGMSEIGPRALGRRSLFYRTDMQTVPELFNNRRIKNREWWRPYGIIILEEELSNYLDTTTKSPYMLHTAQVKNKEALRGVVHVDNSVRYQTVNEDDGWLYDVVSRVFKSTGVPAIVNTSLNRQGYPIMYSKAEFFDYIQTVPGDVFVMGNEVFENV